jgi:hypothetical protein
VTGISRTGNKDDKDCGCEVTENILPLTCSLIMVSGDLTLSSFLTGEWRKHVNGKR